MNKIKNILFHLTKADYVIHNRYHKGSSKNTTRFTISKKMNYLFWFPCRQQIGIISLIFTKPSSCSTISIRSPYILTIHNYLVMVITHNFHSLSRDYLIANDWP